MRHARIGGGLVLAVGIWATGVLGQEIQPPPGVPFGSGPGELPRPVQVQITGPDLALPPQGGLKAPPNSTPHASEIIPTPSGPDPVESSQESPANRQEPGLSIEWTGPPTVKIGQTLPYQIVVRNHSRVPAHQVVVRQQLPENVVLRGSEPEASREENQLVWSLGSIPPGQARRIELQLTAQTRGLINCQATVTFSTLAAMQVHVREPLLALKIRCPDKATAGDKVPLLFTVSNPGDGPTEGVKVKAMLSEGLENSRGRIIEVELGNLAPKEIRNFQLVCTAGLEGIQKCQAIASGEGNLTAAETAQVEVLMPRLNVALAGPKLRYIDRHAVYQVKVANQGSAPASQITVQEVVPAGFKFHSATGGGKFDEASRTVTWAVGDLSPGQHKEVHLELVAAGEGDFRHQAIATGGRGLKTGAELRTRVEGLSALVLEVVDLDDPLEVGTDTTYEIRLSNGGTKIETNLELVCQLPDLLEFKSAKCTAGGTFRVDGKEITFDSIPRLAPRADVIYRIQVRGIAPGDCRFRCRVRADGQSESVSREEPTRVYNDNPQGP